MNRQKQLHQRPRSEISKSDEFETPMSLYNILCNECGIHPILDVAATPTNSKCKYYFSKSTNALKRHWVREVPKTRDVEIWCNPPNSLTQKFIRKAYEQWQKHNISIMMLIPINSIVTKAGTECVWDKAEIYPIVPTPKFIYDGKQLDSARNRYCVIVFRKINT